MLDLEKLDPLHVQSDTGCKKGLSWFLKYENNFLYRHWIAFNNQPTFLIHLILYRLVFLKLEFTNLACVRPTNF